MNSYGLWFAAILFFAATPTTAADIAMCGESKGYGYYPSFGLRQQDDSIWSEDGIQNGRITLTLTEVSKFDILFADATGAVISATQDGGKVVKVGQNDYSISVIVAYPMVIESYTFIKTAKGPEVMWTQNKHSTPIIKVSAFRALCTFVNLPRQ